MAALSIRDLDDGRSAAFADAAWFAGATRRGARSRGSMRRSRPSVSCALVRRVGLATRTIRDVEHLGLELTDPWQ